ncbi:MAG: class I SAM-dependent RNA methyltransferase [Proteobacteria bacterium]|nr:class I SAM-dependent RNA methyltransferase [Pseudomonadota bacterium]MBS0573980.1 class I SAM-dependent RNA methyltransferase [Pseudomonadota bacterium]
MRLTIDRLGHLGDGIGQGGPDGAPVYVARVLPGEVVEGEAVGGRMDRPAIVAPSPDRRRPPCPHYAACGGCALMHATDGFVAGWKAGVVAAALAGQGLEAPVLPADTSPERSRRRATLAGRRTKKGAIVGFHGRASGTLVEVKDCALLLPSLNAVLPLFARITEAGASRKAELALTVTATEGGIDLAAVGGKDMDAPLFTALAGLADAGDLARLAWNGEVVVARRPARQGLGRALVAIPPGAFLQATREGEAALLAEVRATAGAARRVADLFSGAGTFALPLAEAAEVHAAEADPALIAALRAAARATPGLHPVSAEARDLFRRPLLAGELNRFDAVILDPPRAGAEAQVQELARSRVPVVAYVSCNPVTFARDARILTGAGYRLERVLPVDQFRWSPHVELAARFRRP